MAHMIGERIREARQAQDRSLADVASKAKISVATLSRIENEKQSVEMGLFLTIARILSVTPQRLIGEDGNGDVDGVDPLARRIAALPPRERLDLWRELAQERRAQRSRKRGNEVQQVGQHVEELVAQMDFLREELESIRKQMKRR